MSVRAPSDCITVAILDVFIDVTTAGVLEVFRGFGYVDTTSEAGVVETSEPLVLGMSAANAAECWQFAHFLLVTQAQGLAPPQPAENCEEHDCAPKPRTSSKQPTC